jgi:hypothetical protein
MQVWKSLGLGSAIALCLAGSTIAQSPLPVKPDVPYVPTPEAVVLEMLKLGNVTSKDVVYDLGSGDGRLVINAVQKFGAKRGIGIEINPGLVNRSVANAKTAGVSDRTTFTQQDLFKTDFRNASVITLYLLPRINLELRPKLLSELKPGSRVVSHSFDMGEWKPDRTVLVKDGGRPRSLYLWVIPAQVSGTWQGIIFTKSGQKAPYSVQVKQNFQTGQARVNVGGQTMSLPQVRLVGDRVTLEHHQKLNGQDINVKFNGQIVGNMLEGTAEIQNGTATEIYQLAAKRQVN